MSKSDPESAIFMEDSEADVNVKLKKAYCPPGQVEVSSFVYLFIRVLVCRMGD
jgi:tyrosyl-tRNA synthetase